MRNTIRVGQRVRATSKTNDDFAEFRVHATDPTGLGSFSNYYDASEFTFEVLAPSIPAVAGLYSFTNGGGRQVMLTKDGDFFLVDFSSDREDAVEYLAEEKHKNFFEKYELVLNYAYTDDPSQRPVLS